MVRSLTHHRTHLATIATWAMFSRGLEPEFPRAVVHQIAQIHGPAIATDPDARDLRDLTWCSIDNEDSRDLDQITVSSPLPHGGVRILVAISDVDALVPKGSPIDDHARLNTTSVYTSARIFPVLPERLSTDLTSLCPDQERLAIVFEMDFSEDAVLTQSTLYRARVCNRAQLDYDSVSAWLEGQTLPPAGVARIDGLDAQLRTQDRLAQQLRALRHDAGALELETIAPRALFEGERIMAIREQPRNRARQLIEELMIAANGCAARFLATRQSPSLRRVVRSPDRWQRLVDLAHTRGTSLPREPDAAALEHFLAREHRHDPLRFPDLSLIVVKLMGAGEYVVEYPHRAAVGHFALAVRDYMHSTAPNRRFPDLVTQRLIKAALAGAPPPYGSSELEALANHCTVQEDAAQKVERQLRKSEAALLLHARVGHRFDAVVTGSGPHGVWVRIFDPPAEGRLLVEASRAVVGQILRVRLRSTSVERGFIDFDLAD